MKKLFVLLYNDMELSKDVFKILPIYIKWKKGAKTNTYMHTYKLIYS